FLRGMRTRGPGAQNREHTGASVMANDTAASVRSAPAKAAALYRLWCETIRGPGRDPELYALLDAARDPAIHRGLGGFGATEQIACLYQGAAAEDLGHVAPWLVRLGPRTDVFDWIWDKGWGDSWGVFIWSTATVDALRAHFRKLTKVRREEDGKV